jgi:hypothetical protein
MGYITDEEYYENGTPGSYQYIPLTDIVSSFKIGYTGNHQLVNNVGTSLILFHAKRAIQELSYDASRELRVLEFTINEMLKVILPPDFVNWVRISIYKNHTLYPLSENVRTIASQKYSQLNGQLVFDDDGYVVKSEETEMNTDRINGDTNDIYMNRNFGDAELPGRYYGDAWHYGLRIGARYGSNSETANANPTFKVDTRQGVIDFSSDIQGETCIIEYISDGMANGNDANISVNKLFEAYIYAYINYEILKSKLGVQEYIVSRARKEKHALLRNAKLRMSNLHSGRLLMNLRGGTKTIR